MDRFRLGITRAFGSQLAADTTKLPGRITGAAGLIRQYGDFRRSQTAAAPTTGRYCIFGGSIITSTPQDGWL